MELGERARTLRNNPTDPETFLWRHLSRSQLGGYKFRRQHVIEPYIVDFFCPLKGLIVEADGETHEPVADARRDAYLLRRGFLTLRFTNADIRTNMDGVLTTILEALNTLPDRWAASPGVPHPHPSPQGKGLKAKP